MQGKISAEEIALMRSQKFLTKKRAANAEEFAGSGTGFAGARVFAGCDEITEDIVTKLAPETDYLAI
jgi:hypothetical protein